MPLQVKKVQMKLKDGQQFVDGDLLFNIDAQAWARGKRNGQTVSSTDPTYHDNAKYYSEQAAASATAAATSALTGNLAPDFASNVTYSQGDYVTHEGVFYRFTSDHAAGAWTGNDVEAIMVNQVLNEVEDATDNAIVVNKPATDDTKIKIDTTDEDVDLATMEDLENYAPLPEDDHAGTAGYVLRSNGDGSTEWAMAGTPTDGQTQAAVDEWMDGHSGQYVIPDGNVTTAKIADDAVTEDKIVDGAVTQDKLDDDLKLKAIKDYVTPQMFGARGDGVTDDTTAIQAAINSGKNVYFTGSYLSNDLIISISKTILFGNGIIKKIATDSGSYELIAVNGNNIRIDGLTIIGDRDEHLGVSGEWGSCLKIGGKNASITNCKIQKAWGDGIYIINDGCVVDNCVIDYCSRNGISVIKSKDFILSNLVITNTNRTAPKYAIDVEPNTDEQLVSGIITNIITRGNIGGSVVLSLQNCGSNTVSILVDGVMSYGDCTEHTNVLGTFGVFVNSGIKLYAKFDNIYVEDSIFHIFGLNSNYLTTENIEVEFNCYSRNHNYTDIFYFLNSSDRLVSIKSNIKLYNYSIQGIVTGAGNGKKQLLIDTNVDKNYPNISSNLVKIIPTGNNVIDVSNRLVSSTNIEAAGDCIRFDNGYIHYYYLTVKFNTTTSSNYHFYTDYYRTLNGQTLLAAKLEGSDTDVGAYIDQSGLMRMNSIPQTGVYTITGMVYSMQQ